MEGELLSVRQPGCWGYPKMNNLYGFKHLLPVENLYWSHHTGQYLYFTVYGDDIEGTVAEVVERLEIKLGKI